MMSSGNLAISPKSQTVTLPSAPGLVPLYPFLSHPPQKKRPTQPLPAVPSLKPRSPERPSVGRPRSASMTAISAWAAKVLPGSPAPCSPRRSPSLAFTGRFSRRFSGGSGGMLSSSFGSFGEKLAAHDRPVNSPSIHEYPHDLTAMGYTSVFVQFPTTPVTPPKYYLNTTLVGAARPEPASSVKQSKVGLKRLKSLTSLKSSKPTRPKTPLFPPSVGSKSAADIKASSESKAATAAKRRMSKYVTHRPTPIATDLAIAQLMDGGKLDDHVKHYVEAQAKANGAPKVDGQIVGVGDVWRDEEGRIWRDQDEVWEFAHLLSGDDDFCLDEVEWVQFGSVVEGENKLADIEHRGSVSTQDSDLSPRYAMKVETDSHDDLALLDSIIKPGLAVMAIPARSRRAAKHLRKPEFLLDAFTLPASPTAPLAVSQNIRSPRSPRTFTVSSRGKGKARRRPPPLNLTPAGPALKQPHNPADNEQLRTEFLQDSFKPRPRRGRQTHRPTALVLSTPTMPAHAAEDTPPSAGPRKALTAKSSIANLKKGFLKAIGGKKPNAA